MTQDTQDATLDFCSEFLCGPIDWMFRTTSAGDLVVVTDGLMDRRSRPRASLCGLDDGALLCFEVQMGSCEGALLLFHCAWWLIGVVVVCC